VKKRKVKKIEFEYQPYFYLFLPDPHAFADMIEALESAYRVEECVLNTYSIRYMIYDKVEGYRIYCKADEIRKVAEKIELQTRFRAELYNVDIRMDQKY